MDHGGGFLAVDTRRVFVMTWVVTIERHGKFGFLTWVIIERAAWTRFDRTFSRAMASNTVYYPCRFCDKAFKIRAARLGHFSAMHVIDGRKSGTEPEVTENRLLPLLCIKANYRIYSPVDRRRWFVARRIRDIRSWFSRKSVIFDFPSSTQEKKNYSYYYKYISHYCKRQVLDCAGFVYC